MTKTKRKPIRCVEPVDPDALTVLRHEHEINPDLYDDFFRPEDFSSKPDVTFASMIAALKDSHRWFRYETPEACVRQLDTAVVRAVAALVCAAAHFDGETPQNYSLLQPPVPVRIGHVEPAELSSFWLDAYSLSLVRGRTDLSALLVAIDPKHFAGNQFSRPLQHEVDLIHCILAFERGDRSAAQTAVAKTRGSVAQRGAQAGVIGEFATMLAAPRLDAFERLVANDAAGLDTALAHAFRQHRAFWNRSRGLNRGDGALLAVPQGWVSHTLAGIMAMAKRAGMSLKVQSGYAPEWMFATPS
jgi:hypothetical protein